MANDGRLATCLTLTVFYVLVAVPLAWCVHVFWLRRHGFKLSRRRPALTVISNAAGLCVMASRVWQLWMVYSNGFEVVDEKDGEKNKTKVSTNAGLLFVYFLYTFFLWISMGVFLFPLAVRLWLTYFEVNLAVANNDKQWITLITAELNWKSPLRVIRDPKMTPNRLTMAHIHNHSSDGRSQVNSVSMDSPESPVSGVIISEDIINGDSDQVIPTQGTLTFSQRMSSNAHNILTSIDRDKTTVSTAALKRGSVAQGGSTSKKYRRQSLASRAISNDYSVHNYNKRSTNILLSPSGRRLISDSGLRVGDDSDEELDEDDYGDYPTTAEDDARQTTVMKKTLTNKKKKKRQQSTKDRTSTDPSDAVTAAVAATTAAVSRSQTKINTNSGSVWIRGSVTSHNSDSNVLGIQEAGFHNNSSLRSTKGNRDIFERQSWFFLKMHTFGNERWVLQQFGQLFIIGISVTLTIFLLRKFVGDGNTPVKILATLYYVLMGLVVAGFFLYIAVKYPHYYRDSLNVYDELKLLTSLLLCGAAFSIVWLIWASSVGYERSPFEVEAVLNFGALVFLGMMMWLETYWVLDKVGDSGRPSDRISGGERFTLANMSRALNESERNLTRGCCVQFTFKLDQWVFGTNDADMIQMAREELDKTDAGGSGGGGALVETAVLGANNNTLKLLDILASENGFREFMSYLFSEFAYENLVCLLELLQFRQLIVETQMHSVSVAVVEAPERSTKSRTHTRGVATMAKFENALARLVTPPQGLFGGPKDSGHVRDPVPPTPNDGEVADSDSGHVPNVTEFNGELITIETQMVNEDGNHNVDLISPKSSTIETAQSTVSSFDSGRASMTAPLARPSIHDPNAKPLGNPRENKPRNNTRASLTAHSESAGPLALHAKVRVVLPTSVMNIKSSIVWDRYLTIEEKYLVICEKYLLSHSELPINLSFRTRKNITKLADELKEWYRKNPLYENINGEIVGETAPEPEDLENKPVVDEQVFDVVIKELKGLLRDTLSRFHNTEAFKKLQSDFDRAQAAYH